MGHTNDSNFTDHGGSFQDEFAINLVKSSGKKLIVKIARVNGSGGWNNRAVFSVCTFH